MILTWIHQPMTLLQNGHVTDYQLMTLLQNGHVTDYRPMEMLQNGHVKKTKLSYFDALTFSFNKGFHSFT